MNEQKLPNSTTVLILGILSIPLCCCYGVLSIILGGIGLYLAKKDTLLYETDTNAFAASYGTLKTGKILCIIGIVLGVLYIVMTVGLYSWLGWDAFGNQQLIQERMEDAIR